MATKHERPAPLPACPVFDLTRPEAWPWLAEAIREARRQHVLGVDMEDRGQPGAEAIMTAWMDRHYELELLALRAPAPDRAALEIKLQLIESEPDRGFDVLGDKLGRDGMPALMADLRRFLAPLTQRKAQP